MQISLKIKSYRNYRLVDFPTLYDAAEFFLQELTHGNDYGKVRIEIQLVKCIPTSEGESDREHWGECFEVVRKTQKSYIVRLVRDLPFQDLIKTLAHEMVHVVQGMKGHLFINDQNVWIWKGKEYGIAPYTGEEIDDTLPWEDEALTKEVTLSRKYVKLLFS